MTKPNRIAKSRVNFDLEKTIEKKITEGLVYGSNANRLSFFLYFTIIGNNSARK